MNKFLAGLRPGQITFADNYATRRRHLIRLETTAHDEDVADLRRLSASRRASRIAKIPPRRRELWTASALCGVRGETSAYGRVSRYHWRPARGVDPTEACQGCLRAWRELGEPEVAGWDRSASSADAWPWPLPFGWRSADPAGHPWDVPIDQPIEAVRDGTGAVVGEHRAELLRWVRGPRVVRLVRRLDVEDSFEVRCWRIDVGPERDKKVANGLLSEARKACHQLMARGGY